MSKPSANAKMIEQSIKDITSDIESVESNIYDIETSYLEETFHYGNIIRGWEGYLDRYDNKTTTTSFFFQNSLLLIHKIPKPQHTHTHIQ